VPDAAADVAVPHEARDAQAKYPGLFRAIPTNRKSMRPKTGHSSAYARSSGYKRKLTVNDLN